MMPDWVADGLVGLAGGIIFALTRLRADLCEGDKPATRREQGAAYMQFGIFVISAPFFAATVTPGIMRHVGQGANSWVTWPMVAAFIGVSANYLWPIVINAYGYALARWIKGGDKS